MIGLALSILFVIAATGCGASRPTPPDGSVELLDDAGSGEQGCNKDLQPLCCVGSCGNDVVRAPVCEDGAWACPADTVSCPHGTCQLPVADGGN